MMDAKNDIFAYEDKAFEKVKSQVAFLYLDLDFNQLDLFKAIKNNQLVYEVPHGTPSQ